MLVSDKTTDWRTKMKEKKLRKSGIAIACYAIAGVLMLYVIYSVISAVAYLNSYFAQYGMTIGDSFGDAFSYIVSATLNPLVMAVLIFMAGYILEAVRSLNPANYISEEELAAMKAEKAAKKEAAKAEKEAAKAEKVEEAALVEAEAEVIEEKETEEIAEEAEKSDEE